MKHISFSLFVIFALCFFGCQSPGESKSAPPNESGNTPPRESGNTPPNEYDAAGKGYFFPAGLNLSNALRNLPRDHYYESNQWSDSTFILLSSEEEVDELLGETYSATYSGYDQSWVRDDRFENIIKKYDYGFFENNQLLTFFVWAAGGANYFELRNTTYQNDILTVELDHLSAGFGHAAMVSWFAMVEVEKVSAETQVEIIINNRGW